MKSYLPFFVVVFLGSAVSQESNTFHRISAGVGYAPILQKDRLASPFNQTGAGLYANLAYRLARRTQLHDFNVLFLTTTLSSKISGQPRSGDHTSEFAALGAGYRHMRRVMTFHSDKIGWYAGGAWNFLFSIRNHRYGYGLDDETFAEVFSAFCLSTSFLWDWNPATDLEYASDLGLFSYAFRSPYGIQNDRLSVIATNNSFLSAYLKLASWRTPDKMFYWQHRISGRRVLGGRLDFLPSYELTFYRFSQPRKSITILNRLTAGLGWRW